MGWLGKALGTIDPSTTTMQKLAKRRLKEEEIPRWRRDIANLRGSAQSEVNNLAQMGNNQLLQSSLQDYGQDLKGVESDIKRYMKRYNFYTDAFPDLMHELGFAITTAGAGSLLSAPSAATAAQVGSAAQAGGQAADKTVGQPSTHIAGTDLGSTQIRIPKPKFQPEMKQEPVTGLLAEMSPYLREYYKSRGQFS